MGPSKCRNAGAPRPGCTLDNPHSLGPFKSGECLPNRCPKQMLAENNSASQMMSSRLYDALGTTDSATERY
jgi:hypothetical protein